MYLFADSLLLVLVGNGLNGAHNKYPKKHLNEHSVQTRTAGMPVSIHLFSEAISLFCSPCLIRILFAADGFGTIETTETTP